MNIEISPVKVNIWEIISEYSNAVRVVGKSINLNLQIYKLTMKDKRVIKTKYNNLLMDTQGK